jgi:E3 ubiquitin-protein ligase SHPRH
MGIFEKEARAKKRKQKQQEKERANQPQGASGSTSAMDVDNDPPDLTRGADGKFLKWCDYVHQYDVVITTYSTLRSEVHAARPGREREGKGDYLRSPLIAVEWKRVVMDEVQMVGGGSTA